MASNGKTRAVVCGATGFIGRNIAERFAKRSDLDVVGVFHDRPPFQIAGMQWIQADLTRAEDVDRAVAGADVIIQAAATTSGAGDIVRRPHIHTTDNAVMNSLLLRAAFTHKIKNFLFFSCTVMYQPATVPLREDDFDPRAGIQPAYFASGWTKLYIERMCEFYSRISDTRFTVLRHSNIYGPHDKFDLGRSHVFGATITKVMTAPEGGNIVVWGTGEEGRDLLYVSDLVDCVELAIDRQSDSYALYNVGTGYAVAIRDLVRRIIALSGKSLTISHDLSKPTIPTTLALDCSRMRESFGWTPKVSLDQGVLKTLAWWRDNSGAHAMVSHEK